MCNKVISNFLLIKLYYIYVYIQLKLIEYYHIKSWNFGIFMHLAYIKNVRITRYASRAAESICLALILNKLAHAMLHLTRQKAN